MSQGRTEPTRPLPKWLITAGSVAILFHLSALVLVALSAPSGPWPTDFGASPALAPKFAEKLNEVTNRYYLQPLRMWHTFHYESNRPEMVGVYFEVKLKDEKGQEIETLRFPQKDANPWVRHRQQLLAQGLAGDQPLPQRGGERVIGSRQKAPTLSYWKADPTSPDQPMRHVTEPEHLVPRDPNMAQPSKWSLLLAEAYMRYLCRERGAASAELIRYSRPAIRPEWMFLEQEPPDAFRTLSAHFGEYRREK